MSANKGEILIYQSEDGLTNVEVTIQDETVWLSQQQMAELIISLGYRIKSLIATRFRKWATERLKEYMIKGFTMDDERLKGNGGGNYWKELLDRIRDIR